MTLSGRGQGGERIPGTVNRKVKDLEGGINLELKSSKEAHMGGQRQRDEESRRKCGASY